MLQAQWFKARNFIDIADIVGQKEVLFRLAMIKAKGYCAKGGVSAVRGTHFVGSGIEEGLV